jgi:tetratricopeptide (TPR) repeat protein
MRLAAPDLLIALALALVTFLVFARAAQNDFLNFDDQDYVTENQQVLTGLSLGSLRWALTTFHAANYHPLTWISHQLDCQLFGLSPVEPHLENAAIHAISTSLLFTILTLGTARRWPSAACAALFGWHPLRVESVVWIAERKDVLSVFLFLLTLLEYLLYARRPAPGPYILTFVLLTLGLLAKPMLVMAPVLLLLMDYWPLKRLSDAASFRLLVAEKIPFFALSIASSIVTIAAQHAGGTVTSLSGIPLYARLNNSACSVIAYITKLLFPVKLAPYYPFPADQSLWRFLSAIILLAVVTLVCIRCRRDRPYLLFGWLWFVASLLPVIGLLQVGVQSMADRYSYIPSIGLLVAIVWSTANWYDRHKAFRPLLIAISVCATSALLPMTYRQIGFWKNDLILFSYTDAVTQDNWMAELKMAEALVLQGDLEDAEIVCQKSIRVNRNDAAAALATFLRLLRSERLPGEAEYAQEVRANPSDPLPHYNWANLLLRGGRYGQAIVHYQLYLDARPNDKQGHNNLGIALASIGDLHEAEEEFAKAIQLDPDYADAQCGLGTALFGEAKYNEAAESFSRALELDPAMSRARSGLDQCRSRLSALPRAS